MPQEPEEAEPEETVPEGAESSAKIVKRVQVQEIMHQSQLGITSISEDFLDRLDEKVKQLILQSLQRAKENNRRTVMGRDI